MKAKLLFSLLAIALATLGINAQTTIPAGDVEGTWTLAGSPYLIYGVTTIPDSATLTIEPGVLVEWQGSFPMFVHGQILASGTETDSIIFTAADTVTGFKGIRFEDTPLTNDTSRFAYCVFKYGRAYGVYPDNCGGVMAALNYSKFTIDHCLFDANKAIVNIIHSSGGAIALWTSSPVIRNSKFINNISCAGGAIITYMGSNPLIENNMFAYNTVIDFSAWGQGFGGAIMCYIDSHPLIKNNIFRNNLSSLYGGAISCVDACSPVIDHNLFYNNTAEVSGGAIDMVRMCSTLIINNTIVHNHGNIIGGGINIEDECNPEIRNTILWGNTANEGNQVNIQTTNCVPGFYYSDIQGGEDSIGGAPVTGDYRHCIDSDPLFEDPLTGDYHLSWASFPVSDSTRSPCIDAGDPVFLDPDSTVCDIGAFCFDQTGVGFPEFSIPYSALRIECYPNPLIKSANFKYELEEPAMVSLIVYNHLGQHIKTLVNHHEQAGRHQVTWNAERFPPGIYSYILQAGKLSASGKIVVLR